jgi:hypothetical protein
VRLVIECKRTKHATWVFINPDSKNDDVALAKFLWADLRISQNELIIDTENMTSTPAYRIISGAYDFVTKPTSLESEFCAIRGGGENDKPLLERICGQLLKAIDCLSVEEMEIAKKKTVSDACIYVPVVITNAQLELCHYDPEKVSLTDGLLSDGKFEAVPFIRFRKSLTTALSSRATPSNIMDAHKDKERTVLIINADYFCKILEIMEVKLPPYTDSWPWFYNS